MFLFFIIPIFLEVNISTAIDLVPRYAIGVKLHGDAGVITVVVTSFSRPVIGMDTNFISHN